jgi:hypothetical protein
MARRPLMKCRDSKKLTFFYFADSYINFNSLVTDLFKVYKTRIWMSAINPASFQTPTSSLGLTPAPPAQHFQGTEGGARRSHGYDSRRQPGPMGYDGTYEGEQSIRGSYMAQPYQPFQPSIGASSAMPPFGANLQSDPFGDSYYQPSYGMLNPNAQAFAAGRPGIGSRQSNQSPHNDWTGRFQGLSLGS